MKTRLKLKSITRTMLNLLFPLNINTKQTTTTTIYNIYYVNMYMSAAAAEGEMKLNHKIDPSFC